MEEARELLSSFNMHKTPCRVEMLSTLIHSQSALTELEIKQRMSYEYDRATIFRNLKAFLKAGVIHGVPLEGGEVRYQVTAPQQCDHIHAHFHCKQCSNLYCLKAVEIQKLNLPDGYKADEYDLVIKGFCDNCAAIKQNFKNN